MRLWQHGLDYGSLLQSISLMGNTVWDLLGLGEYSNLSSFHHTSLKTLQEIISNTHLAHLTYFTLGPHMLFIVNSSLNSESSTVKNSVEVYFGSGWEFIFF